MKPTFISLVDCKSTLTLYKSFRHHVYHKHGEHVLPENDGNDTDLNNGSNMVNMDNDLQPKADVPPSMEAIMRKENLCSFILNVEKNHIPQAVQQEIANDNILEYPELKEVMPNDFFLKASAAVRSPYMLKEHCKSKLKLVDLCITF